MKLISLFLLALSSCTGKLVEPIVHSPQRIMPAKYDVKLTAYTGNRTALGTRAKPGVIATDWSVFPVGTILRINNANYRVEDYGSALIRPYNSKPIVDVYKSSNGAVRRFGSRRATIEVVKWGSFAESKKILKTRLKNKHCRAMYNKIN